MLLIFATIAATVFARQSAQAPAQKNSRSRGSLSAAQQAQHNEDYATAEREYVAVLALAPEFAEVHMNLGLVYQLEDRSADAMTEFRRALKIKPGLAGANFFLGVDYCKLGEGANAITYLKAALKAEPGRPDTWLWLATAQEIAGQWQAEVGTSFQRALALRPADVDLLYLLGSAYERLGKQEVAHLEKVAPGSSRSEQLLAESYASSNEWPSAVIHFQNALAASPNRQGLHTELGEVFLHAGKVNQAVLEFDTELQRNPGSLRALGRRGEARLIQGNLDAALQDWKKQRASMWNGRNEYWGFGKLDSGIQRWNSFLIPLAKKSRPTKGDCKIGILRRRIWRLLFSLYRAGICGKRRPRPSPPSRSALLGRTLPRGV